jgi:hypothetical protein
LTSAEAKNYAMNHLPCTMSGVTELFQTDIAHVRLHKIVGMKPGSLGYRSLVFYFQHRPIRRINDMVLQVATEEQVRKYLKWWFENKLNGIVGPCSDPGVEDQVWWVRVPIEIKEDRASI